MNDVQDNAGLLEYLSQKAGCTYISDLCQLSYLPMIRAILATEDVSHFSIEQWNDAVCYITKCETIFETAAQAKDFLMKLA